MKYAGALQRLCRDYKAAAPDAKRPGRSRGGGGWTTGVGHGGSEAVGVPCPPPPRGCPLKLVELRGDLPGLAFLRWEDFPAPSPLARQALQRDIAPSRSRPASWAPWINRFTSARSWLGAVDHSPRASDQPCEPSSHPRFPEWPAGQAGASIVVF